MGSLVLTYFRRRLTDYHWRGGVSRSCSGREGVVPPRYGHQTERGVTWFWHGAFARTRILEEVWVLGGDCLARCCTRVVCDSTEVE